MRNHSFYFLYVYGYHNEEGIIRLTGKFGFIEAKSVKKASCNGIGQLFRRVSNS